MRVTWLPVLSADQNGIITGYTVYYRAVTGNIVNSAEQSVTVNGTTTSVDIPSLEEHVVYNVSVSANTSVGEGPRSSEVTERTAQASKY